MENSPKKYGTHSGKMFAKMMEKINLKTRKMQQGKSSFKKNMEIKKETGNYDFKIFQNE